MSKTIIIAEAGVNHNGDIEIAKKLVDVAANSGADYVKFQTFKADNLVSRFADKADYQKRNTRSDESHHAMIQRLEIDYDMHIQLIDHCKKKNIRFLSTPFDIPSIDLLIKLKMDLLKIPSGEITNFPYLKYIGSRAKSIIMSTGMATLKEVHAAMNILLEAGLQKEKLIILHCNTEYPTPMHDVNMIAMLTIRDELNVNIGYSDHTLGIEAPIAAVALGANVIEKHFTLDRTFDGPDHSASLEPGELKNMVSAIRNIEKALGDGIKKPSNSERKNLPIARKSIVANQKIGKGEKFTELNLTTKRPGSGVSPMQWDKYIGKVSSKNYKKDDLII